jgi:microcystin-dependent protein
MLMLTPLLLTPARSLAQGPTAPDLLPYQGTLVNGDGEPLGMPSPRNYDVVFRIFDASSGGNLVWSEQQTVTVDNGRFSVQLGQGAAFEAEPRPAMGAVFRAATASDRYLETTVKGVGSGGVDSTLLVRTRLLPVPFAMVAQHARTAERIVNNANARVITIVGGRVGINSTNPATALDVVGSAQAASLEARENAQVRGTATAAAWVGGGAAPVGSIILWSGTIVDRPEGWALCDGTVVNGYPTPDLRGRFVLGAGEGAGLTPRKVGAVGGAESHVLTEEEMPSHAHAIDPVGTTTVNTGNHVHALWTEAGDRDRFSPGDYGAITYHPSVHHPMAATANEVSVSQFTVQTTASGGVHAHTLDVPESRSELFGGGRAHPNMPPFYVLAYLVRVR